MSANLASIVFTLKAENDTALPVNSGPIMQGAFLNWLQQDLPELAAKLHDKYQRFYTVSPLMGDFTQADRRLKIHADQPAWFRVTVMNDEILDGVLAVAAKQTTGPQLEDANWQPGAVITEPATNEFVRLGSFAQLVEEMQALADSDDLPPEVILRFISPACFIENEQSLPLPVPNHVFGYLFNLWQGVCPFPLPLDDVNHFIDNIHLGYASIKTQFVEFKKFRRVGFTGLCRFGLHPKFPSLYRMLLHVLAKFTFFSGVGSHTAMGMGQTHYLLRV